ncbi:MAG: bile acid:sodium symporter [Methylocapsa sp.]|nr:bile acid:sodium symporter [Methylocapsa sp.]
MPGFGIWIRNAGIGGAPARHSVSLPILLLAALLFNAGVGIRTPELAGMFRNPFLLLGGLFLNLAVPLAFIFAVSFLTYAWHNQNEVQEILVGLALVASMPIAGASSAWSQICEGSLALSLGLILSSTALSPLVIPFVLHTAGFVTTGDYSEDLHELASGGAASFVGIWVILPALLGMALRYLAGEQCVARAGAYLKLTNYCVLLLLNYSNASLALPDIIAHPDFDFLFIMLLIVLAYCVSGFATGYLLSRAAHGSDPEKFSLIFGLGMSNNGLGLVLASVALADHPLVMLPVISFNLVQNLVASIVARATARKPPLAPPAR